MLFTPWILLAAAGPVAAQAPPAVPAQPAAGENQVRTEFAGPEIVQSARAAVEKLGVEVVAGRYQIAIDRMYPAWKDRLANREGGMDKLNAKLAEAPKALQRAGMTLLSFKPEGAAKAIEVWPGKKVETVGGRQVETLVYTKWLVTIPTVTRIRVIKDGKVHLVESTGFQIAITDKGKNDWTFIDGSTVSISDLRSVFLTLPDDLKLPPLGGREITEPQR